MLYLLFILSAAPQLLGLTEKKQKRSTVRLLPGPPAARGMCAPAALPRRRSVTSVVVFTPRKLVKAADRLNAQVRCAFLDSIKHDSNCQECG